MSQLSLSWLGLGQLAASPWLLLLLAGATWLLARILAWSYSLYDICCRLRCFPQPPKRNWLWGHVGLIPPTEQGLRVLTQLVATYPQGFKLWMGLTLPLVVLCHPDMVRSVTSASGTHADLVVVGPLTHPRGSNPSISKLPCSPCRSLASPPPSLSAIFLFPSSIHHPPSHPLLPPLLSALPPPPWCSWHHWGPKRPHCKALSSRNPQS
uniref:Uncharacterized protein n=1 Tax=Ursus americanus TaxID=9643 RepID=A0A452SWF6_URSAM